METTAIFLFFFVTVTLERAFALSSTSPLVSIAFIIPHRNLTNSKMREELRRLFSPPAVQFLADGSSSERNLLFAKSSQLNVRFQVNPVYVTKMSVPETVSSVFCSPASRGLNAVLVVVDKKLQNDDEASLASFVTTLAHNAGISSMLWSSAAYQFEESLAGESYSKKLLLLSPTIRDQALAILDFLQSQNLNIFSVIASMQTPGADTFVRVLREQSDLPKATYSRADYRDAQRKLRLAHVTRLPNGLATSMKSWRKLVRSELLFIRGSSGSRTIILWSDVEQANDIIGEARVLGMTSEGFLWIGGQPVVDDLILSQHEANAKTRYSATNIVPGTIAVSYRTSLAAQFEIIKTGTEIWTRAVKKLASLQTALSANVSEMAPADSCSTEGSQPWSWQTTFFRFLAEAKREATGMASFIPGRTVTFSYLTGDYKWRRLGHWTQANRFMTNDSDYNPWAKLRGIPTKTDKLALLRIVTLEEPPYVIYGHPDHDTGRCPNNGVICELSPLYQQIAHAPLEFEKHENFTSAIDEDEADTANETSYACCSGFCIDLLQRLAKDIGFRYHLQEVRDRKWGGKDKVTGLWNGLIKALLDDEAEVAMTSLKINQQRSEAIDFTLPFLETGITIMVAVREGAISPTAFLEPFSPMAWFAILFGCVNCVMLASFFFERISVSQGLGMPTHPPVQGQHHSSFSVFQSLWLCWSMLFKAAVKVELPRSFGAKAMTAVWAMFCVIFASSYMANLAVFMITKDDFYDFSGMDDYRLQNPYTKNPPYRFATISSGATEAFIKQNHPELYDYMRGFNKSSASTGIQAVKEGKLDAFIYDATVLEYKSNQDPDCQLTTVGKWNAMTGYGIAVPRASPLLSVFNKHIITYQYNGFLQQLSEYWLSGACRHRKKAESNKSFQLGVLNITSAFYLLFFGLVVCFVILGVEYLISKYLFAYFIKKEAAAMHTLGKRSFRSMTRGKKNKACNNDESAAIQPASGGNVVTKMFFLTITVRCNNCGGRGHIASICPSHKDMHLLTAANDRDNTNKQTHPKK